jgi:hypothetical protein
MATSAHARTEQSSHSRVRYTSDSTGLQKFLAAFLPTWRIFAGIADILGSTVQTREFEGRKSRFVGYATSANNAGDEEAILKTIGCGVSIIRDLEDFLEEWVEAATANARFDAAGAQIEKLSKKVWSEHKDQLFTLREYFTSASNGDDLARAVLACADVERLLKSLHTRAKSSAESEIAAREGEHRRRENVKAQQKVGNLLAELL